MTSEHMRWEIAERENDTPLSFPGSRMTMRCHSLVNSCSSSLHPTRPHARPHICSLQHSFHTVTPQLHSCSCFPCPLMFTFSFGHFQLIDKNSFRPTDSRSDGLTLPPMGLRTLYLKVVSTQCQCALCSKANDRLKINIIVCT